jgi:hypothetical protein
MAEVTRNTPHRSKQTFIFSLDPPLILQLSRVLTELKMMKVAILMMMDLTAMHKI